MGGIYLKQPDDCQLVLVNRGRQRHIQWNSNPVSVPNSRSRHQQHGDNRNVLKSGWDIQRRCSPCPKPELPATNSSPMSH